MAEYLKLARVYLVLLAIMTVLRFVMGNVVGKPYREFSDKFSIVILTLIATLLYAAFCRAFLGYRMFDAVKLAMTLGLCSQVVIVVATLASYALGAETAFNHPIALGRPASPAVGLADALVVRAGGLVVNTLGGGIVGAIGWALGGLLPPRKS